VSILFAFMCRPDGFEWLYRNILKLRKESEQSSTSKSVPRSATKPVSKKSTRNIVTPKKRTNVVGPTAQKTNPITAESLRKDYRKRWLVRFISLHFPIVNTSSLCEAHSRERSSVLPRQYGQERTLTARPRLALCALLISWLLLSILILRKSP
jgi:hypothetical protein